MLKRIGTFGREEEGAAALEYALLAAFIAAVAITGIGLIGIVVSTSFGTVASAINAVEVR